ncbi:hypothetical protein GW846_01150 [Candidatus Gracilibacteria bacterium]|nr:hypothetical protein [Candidatus Gracilibacteria bacterium]
MKGDTLEAPKMQFRIVYPDIKESKELYQALETLLGENINGSQHLPVICGKREELFYYRDLISMGLQFIEVPDNENNLVIAARELKKGSVHSVLAGNISETGDVISVGLHEIGMLEGVKRASSYFLMESPQYGKYIFADSGCQPNPNVEQLIEIVGLTVQNAKVHGFEPKVALLDGGYDSDKIQAVSDYFENNPIAGVEILGNMSLKDARKSECNTFIFGNLNQGNIAYKVAERMKDFKPDFSSETEKSALLHLQSDENQNCIFGYDILSSSPTSEDLQISALEAIKYARTKGYDLQVAFLSFSTKGSGKNEESILAARQAAHDFPETLHKMGITDVTVIPVEVQFDTAFLPEKAKKKGMDVEKPSTIYILPDRHIGAMIGDIATNLGGSTANGPRLQGFQRSYNDFSRGASWSDIVNGHKTTEKELEKS